MGPFRGAQDAILTPWQARQLMAQCLSLQDGWLGSGLPRLAAFCLDLARMLASVPHTPRGVPVVAVVHLIRERLAELPLTDLEVLARAARGRRDDRTAPLGVRRAWGEMLGAVEQTRRDGAAVPMPFWRAFDRVPDEGPHPRREEGC